MIFPDQKILFIHIPKTGGTTIEYQLSRKFINDVKLIGRKRDKYLHDIYHKYTINGIKKHKAHIKAFEYKKYLGNDYDRHYSFAFFRNPFSQIRSLFNQKINNAKIDSKYHRYTTLSFEEYIMGTRSDCKIEDDIYHTNQLSFVKDNGEIIVDDIFPFEYFPEMVRYLGSKINVDISVNLKLRSTDSSNVYTPEMIEKVLNLRYDDYKYWKSLKDRYRPYVLQSRKK